jgi:HlyD family secretion protein
MRTRTLVLLTTLVIAGGGYYFYGVSARQVSGPDILQAAVTSGDIVETVQVTGTLQPLRTVNVGSQVSGIVAELLADFNSVVRKDQVIARLDPSLLQVQVDLQSAAVERQIGEIRRLEMQLEMETATLERTRALFAKGLVAREALDQAELQVKVRTTEVDAARKMLKTAEANLNQATLNLSHTIIRSPIDGVVVNRLVDVGQTVQSSMNVAQFFTLAEDLRQLRLEAVVDEADIGRIRPGMAVEFTVDAYGDETFRGRVSTVTLNASTQNNVVTYPVWIDVPNDSLRLRPSMTANVLIYVSVAEGVTRVPTTATRFRPAAAMFEALGLPAPETRRLDRSAAPERGSTGNAPESALNQPATARRIDDLFAPVPRRNTAGTVWVWDERARTLTERPVRLGITNGQFTELVDGDLTPDQLVVTNILLPAERNAAAPQNVFGSMGRGGPGGGRGF